MVKLIDILKIVLVEAKQVGKVYHFTTYKKMEKIVKSGFNMKSWTMLYPHLGRGPKEKEYISFTRSKNMASTTKTTIHDDVRITVDGDNMSNKYKFEPFADSDTNYGRGNGSDEMEERLVLDVKKYPNGMDISKYISAIDIKSALDEPKISYFKELIKELKSKNIDFNIVDKF